MTDLRTSFVIDLNGNLQARAKKYSDSLGKFAQNGRKSLNSLSRAAEGYSRGIDRIGNRYTALISGAGLGVAVKQVGEFNDRLLRLGIQANVSDDKLAGLKAKILDVAQQRDISVDPQQILSAIDAIVEKTGDLKFAEDNIGNIGTVIQATGALGDDIGQIMAEFQKMGIKGPKSVLEAIDILNVQGKEGAFTLQELARLGPRVITAYTAAGRGGAEGLREMGAALQVIRQGTGSSDMAATAFEATMRTLADPKKIKDLERLTGISVFDHEKLKKGEKVLRPINELMTEIVEKTKGDATKINTLFDAEAARAFNAMSSEFKRNGSLESIKRFYDVQADGTQTLADAKRGSLSFSAALNTLSSAGLQFSDNNLAEPVKDLAQWLNSVDGDTVQRWLEIGKMLALVTGGLIVASKARRALGSVSGRGGAAGGLGGGSAPIPVYIVGGGGAGQGGGMGGGFGDSSSGPGRGSRFGKFARRAGQGFAVAEAGMAGYAVGTILNEGLTSIISSVSDRDETLGTLISGWINDVDVTAPVAQKDLGGTLNIKIDQEGRARVARLDENGGLAIVAETGQTMGLF